MKITIAPAGGEEFELYQGPPKDLPDALNETITTRCLQNVLKVEDGILKVDARKDTKLQSLQLMEKHPLHLKQILFWFCIFVVNSNVLV